MIRDEDLRSSIDYSEGQKVAAHCVFVEPVNLFYDPMFLSLIRKEISAVKIHVEFYSVLGII